MTDEETKIAGAGENTILEGNTYEAHVWLAQRAILTDELTLAIMHLRMAMELQESIIERATRAHVERAGRDAWEKASPAARTGALDKLGRLLGEDTAMVPLVGQTRAEVPVRQPLPPMEGRHDVPNPIGTRLFAVKASSWAPEEAHTERIGTAGHSSATRVCATCGDRWRYFTAADTSVEPGAYHVDDIGQPLVRQLHRPHE